jgi:hypothetical protein
MGLGGRVGASAAAENIDSGMVLASFLFVAFAYKNRGNWSQIRKNTLKKLKLANLILSRSIKHRQVYEKSVARWQ